MSGMPQTRSDMDTRPQWERMFDEVGYFDKDYVLKLTHAAVKHAFRTVKPEKLRDDGSEFNTGYNFAIGDLNINIRRYLAERRAK
jgi:hypothetical protein